MDWSSISKVLQLENRGVISLVGAGGKTTLMFALARWLNDCGKTVITTTTTKIFIPTTSQSPALVLLESPEAGLSECKKLVEHHGHATVGAGLWEEPKKLKGIDSEMVSMLARSGIADWIIVEADGAAGRPLKAPAPHEPVIPTVSTHLIGIVGLRAIGLPLDERHVFRIQRYAAVANLTPGERITPSSIAAALLHPEGIMKGAPWHARKFAFLNKGGRDELGKTGASVAKLLQKRGAVELNRVFIGSAAEDPACWEWQDTEP